MEITQRELAIIPNEALLRLIHGLEMMRLHVMDPSFDAARSTAILEDDWPPNYPLFVGEAQRRKLCL